MRPGLAFWHRLLGLTAISSLFLLGLIVTFKGQSIAILGFSNSAVFPQKKPQLRPDAVSGGFRERETLRSTAGARGESRDPVGTGRRSPEQARLIQAYGNLPLRFEANRGQTDPRGNGYTLFLTGNEAVLLLQKAEASVLRMGLVGSNPNPQVHASDELSGNSSYFIGNAATRWRTNVPAYAKVKYTGVYPGVDIAYYGNQRQLECDFVVQPGADPTQIVLNVGVPPVRDEPPRAHHDAPLRIDRNGDLVIAMGDGEVGFHKPVVYQTESTVDSRRSKVEPQSMPTGTTHRAQRPVPTGSRETTNALEGKYIVKGDRQVAFEIGSYDRSKVLVIDPVLSYSTYLGGNQEPGGDARGIAVDSSGNAYITGLAGSPDFPTTSGAFQSTCAQVSVGGCGAFVAKLNPAGSDLVYSTYLGGSGHTFVSAIAVDASGNAYVTGSTNASDYPTTPEAFQPQPAAHVFVSSGFVTKLNAEGSALVYSTYLGDNGGGSAIAVDASGSAYVAGSTASLDFPVTAGAFQTACRNPVTGACAGENAFVTKFNPAGSALVYSTYLGGSSTEGDDANGIAVDSSGNAYVAGTTHSSDFPTTPGAFQTKFVGGQCQIVAPPGTTGPVGTRTCADAFVSKLNATGSSLVYSTFLGGSLDDVAAGVALDASENAYVAGTTDSSDFPTTSGAFQTPSGRIFVTKLNPGGSGLVYSGTLWRKQRLGLRGRLGLHRRHRSRPFG